MDIKRVIGGAAEIPECIRPIDVNKIHAAKKLIKFMWQLSVIDNDIQMGIRFVINRDYRYHLFLKKIV